MARRFISGIRMDRSWSLSRTRGELGRVVSVSGARKTKRLRRDALLTVGQPSRLALEGPERNLRFLPTRRRSGALRRTGRASNGGRLEFLDLPFGIPDEDADGLRKSDR